MTTRRIRVITVGVLALMSLASTPVLAAEPPAGQMTWALHFSLAPTLFEPAETPGLITPFMILYALHDALVKPMPDKAMSPSLAESWSTSPDGLVYEFVLRKGATFHNGEPVTPDDVKFSFERYRGVSAKVLKERVAAIEAPDSRRVRFRLKQAWLSGIFGNAATRLEPFAISSGAYAYGGYPDIDGLFKEQAGELDPKKREALLHRIQQLIHDKVMVLPIWQLALLPGVGPRVAESGFGLIADYPWSAPYEDLKLKTK